MQQEEVNVVNCGTAQGVLLEEGLGTGAGGREYLCGQGCEARMAAREDVTLEVKRLVKDTVLSVQE